jgi:hypothetical protein
MKLVRITFKVKLSEIALETSEESADWCGIRSSTVREMLDNPDRTYKVIDNSNGMINFKYYTGRRKYILPAIMFKPINNYDGMVRLVKALDLAYDKL